MDTQPIHRNLESRWSILKSFVYESQEYPPSMCQSCVFYNRHEDKNAVIVSTTLVEYFRGKELSRNHPYRRRYHKSFTSQ